MTERAKTKLIQSIDEIPNHFESEDAERDWWDTHELSDGLWKQLRPRWIDAPDYSPLLLSARDVAQVDAIISAAWVLAEQIEQGRNSRELAVLIDLVTGLEVLSAAALDAGVNLYLTAPVLFIADSSQRAVAAQKVKQAIERSTTAAKLSLVESANLEGLSPDLLNKSRALLQCRDLLTHSSPAMSESSGLSGHAFDFSEATIDAAVERFQAVRELLRLMRLGPEASLLGLLS